MDTFKAITELITVLAWPTTVLTIVLLFRREIHKLLVAIKEVKYPGGSISMQEVNALAASVEAKKAPIVPEVHASLPFSDPLLVIAQVRIDVEREVFRLSESALDSRMATSWVGESRLAPDYIMDRRDTHVLTWDRSRHIDELQRTEVISREIAENLRKFFDISNRIMHGGNVSSDVISGTAAIGADLLAAIRVKRIAYEGQIALNEQMMCSHGERPADEIRYCLISHIAAEADVFGYDYETYAEAVRVFNLRHRRGPGRHIEVSTVTLADFEEGLRWREKELERFLTEIQDKSKKRADVNNWTWPPEWGNVGWSGPIISYGVGLGSDEIRAERELLLTRAALERHRLRLSRTNA